jgi:hypothetical protein
MSVDEDPRPVEIEDIGCWAVAILLLVSAILVLIYGP